MPKRQRESDEDYEEGEAASSSSATSSKDAKDEKKKGVKKAPASRGPAKPFTKEEDLKIIAYLKEQVNYKHLEDVVLEGKRSRTSVRARYLYLVRLWESSLP